MITNPKPVINENRLKKALLNKRIPTPSKPEAVPQISSTPEEYVAFEQVEHAFYDSLRTLSTGQDCVLHTGLNEQGEPVWAFLVARGTVASKQVIQQIEKVMDRLDRKCA